MGSVSAGRRRTAPLVAASVSPAASIRRPSAVRTEEVEAAAEVVTSTISLEGKGGLGIESRGVCMFVKN